MTPNKEDFERWLKLNYRLKLKDIRLTSTRGYWKIIKACGGAGTCPNYLHSTIGNSGPTNHTIRYTDAVHDERGRWASPYRTWRAAKEW